MTSSTGARSGEVCRKINVDQSIEDLVHHNQAAVMTTLLQCWPLEVAQHCSDATVGVVVGTVASHVASCVSLNLFQLVDVLAGRWIPDSGGVLELGSDVCFVSQIANMATERTQVAVQKRLRTVGFFADRIDVVVEAQFGVDGDANIFSCINCFKRLTVHCIRCLNLFALEGYS